MTDNKQDQPTPDAEPRREVTLEELGRAQRSGNKAFLSQVQIEGVATIFDKNGKVKGKMNITSL